MSALRVLVVPPVPLLLPAYAARTDPVPELRTACVEGTRWLLEANPDRVHLVGDLPGEAELARGVRTSVARRVAEHLLAQAGFSGERVEPPDLAAARAVMVLANGSARRGEHAPGHLDPRAHGFDRALGDALAAPDPAALAALDTGLGADLLAAGLTGLAEVARAVAAGDPVRAEVTYDADPFGVQYWVVRWETSR